MAIQDVKCANCGKYLSPVWREKCLHCGVPMAIARPAMIPTPMAMSGERPARVQSVLRGPNEAACLQQAVVDGQRAAANGYAPVWQTWGREGAEVTLTILYDLVQAASPSPQAPITSMPPALPPTPAMPPPPPAPAQASQSWPAPPSAPAPVVMQPVAWAPPPVPQVIVQAPPPPAPTPTASNPSIFNRVFGAIISILVVVVVYWIVAAGERAIF